MIPQDLYMDVHESKIFILDLENLDDKKYSPKVTSQLYRYCFVEWEVLSFVKYDDSISEYIDFEGTDKEKIERFVTTMHKGHPKYVCC
ncbi:12952_t:CDS:2 [Racocetra persica]|uniref:12952_t:CDS:1 n=1 Tax=Racocetra persica TaxID=160502 RepID=A0ACA9KFY1_9GLOM|nr:12952_t:CDS:2 [Racocetra persica]